MDLRQKAVKVRVRRPLDVQVPAADIVKGFVIYLVRDVGVLQERVHAEHGVVPEFFTDAALSMRRPLLRPDD